MELEEAYKKALADERVKTLLEGGFYLSSIFVDQAHLNGVDVWNFVFFNPESGDVFSVSVGESKEEVRVGKVQKPLREGHYERISVEGNEEIQGILDVIGDNVDFQISKVLITFRRGTWDALVIGNNLRTLFLRIDPKTRKVIEKERGSLIRV